MRVLIDACVLYPTLLRRLVMAAAERGAFEPLWSARILEEWIRATGRDGAQAADLTRADAALLTAAWPQAEIPPDPALEATLSLPDPNDVHVLAAAIRGEAGTLLTLNLKDFPTRTLSAHGILRRDPDGFLTELFQDQPSEIGAAVRAVLNEAKAAGAQDPPRTLLKRARLPKLAKRLAERL